ncbi:MAG: SBBP repeat-containing protein [Bradymonadaceae bacterium]
MLLGASGDDRIHGVATDGQGSLYLAGETDSGLGGRSYNGGASDGFVIKMK